VKQNLRKLYSGLRMRLSDLSLSVILS